MSFTDISNSPSASQPANASSSEQPANSTIASQDAPVIQYRMHGKTVSKAEFDAEIALIESRNAAPAGPSVRRLTEAEFEAQMAAMAAEDSDDSDVLPAPPRPRRFQPNNRGRPLINKPTVFLLEDLYKGVMRLSGAADVPKWTESLKQFLVHHGDYSREQEDYLEEEDVPLQIQMMQLFYEFHLAYLDLAPEAMQNCASTFKAAATYVDNLDKENLIHHYEATQHDFFFFSVFPSHKVHIKTAFAVWEEVLETAMKRRLDPRLVREEEQFL